VEGRQGRKEERKNGKMREELGDAFGLIFVLGPQEESEQAER